MTVETFSITLKMNPTAMNGDPNVALRRECGNLKLVLPYNVCKPSTLVDLTVMPMLP
jgi:hypothetical protein